MLAQGAEFFQRSSVLETTSSGRRNVYLSERNNLAWGLDRYWNLQSRHDPRLHAGHAPHPARWG